MLATIPLDACYKIITVRHQQSDTLIQNFCKFENMAVGQLELLIHDA